MQSASPHLSDRLWGEEQFYFLLKIKKSCVEKPCHFLVTRIQDRCVVLRQCLLGFLLSLFLKYWLCMGK